MSNNSSFTLLGGRRVASWCGIVLFVIVGNVLVYSFFTQFEITVRSRTNCAEERNAFSSKILDDSKSITLHQKTFLEIALLTKTTKVVAHKYQCMYEDALAPYRNVKGLKILEIGLGCDMPYGPGASHYIWANYFSDPRITFFDFDKQCAEKWHTELAQNITKVDGDKSKLPKMFYGDQLNQEDLQKMADADGPWDIIIDDGKHHYDHQISALTTLFKDVKPGGTYFIEDLILWGIQQEFNKNSTILKIAELYILSIYETFGKDLLNKEVQDWKVPGLGQRVDRIMCCSSMCGIWVKDANHV